MRWITVLLMAAIFTMNPVDGFSKPTFSYKSAAAQSKSTSSSFGVGKPSSPPAAPASKQQFGIGKPSSPPPAVSAPPPPPKQQFGIGKPTAPPPVASTTPPAAAPKAPVDTTSRAAARSQSREAFAKFQQDQKKYEKPPTPVNYNKVRTNPTFAATENRFRVNGQFDRAAYRSAYDRDVRLITVIPRDRYVYIEHGSPNYGPWSPHVFWGLLGTSLIISDINAQWAYAHRNDDAYRLWREDALRQANNNAELRGQIAALDARIAQMQANNTPVVNTPALPEGITETVAFAPKVVLDDNPDDDNDGPSFWTILGWIVGAFVIGVFLLARRGAQLRCR